MQTVHLLAAVQERLVAIMPVPCVCNDTWLSPLLRSVF